MIIMRMDRDENPDTAGCRYFGFYFNLDDRHPEKGKGLSPCFVFGDRAADLPPEEAEKVAVHLRDSCGYAIEVRSTVEREVSPREQIIADMKAGLIGKVDGAARLRALAAPSS